MTPLATIEQLAIVRGVDLDPEDDLGPLLLDSASQVVRSYCQQLFTAVSGDEVYLHGTGTASLLLPELPVTEVGSIGRLEADGSETMYDEAEYVVGPEGIVWRSETWDRWPLGHRNIHVDYDHGYAVIPADIVLVTLQIAARSLSVATAGGQAVSMEQIGQYQVQYATTLNQQELLPVERGVLDRYRQTRVV